MLAAAAGAAEGSFSLWALGIGLLLLVLNGYFVAAEIALLAARRARVEERAEAGDPRAKIALAALHELSITFSGAQLGITAASFGLGAIAEPAVAALFAGWLEPLAISEGLRSGIAFALALSIVVFLHMVVGEMAPKNLALAQAERVSLQIAHSFKWFVRIFRPLIVLLNATANGLLRVVGVDPVDEHKLVHTPDELTLALLESERQGTIAGSDVRVMTAALRLHDIDAGAAMTPRVDLTAVSDDATLASALEVAASSGHTRLPVYHEDLDHVVGVLNVKEALLAGDVMGAPRARGDLGAPRARGDADVRVADLLRPIAAVPESRDVEVLLRDMLDSRTHAALVVDEFGGTAGMVTLEDILEELVGEIEDEFDEDEDQARRGARGTWVVPGTLRRDEVERTTGLVLDGGESETISGWITEQVGRLVEAGDRVEAPDGWQLTVLSLEGRRAGEVEVRAPAAARSHEVRTGG